MSFLGDLDLFCVEILIHIFKFLIPKDLRNAAQVSSGFRSIAMTNQILRPFVNKWIFPKEWLTMNIPFYVILTCMNEYFHNWQIIVNGGGKEIILAINENNTLIQYFGKCGCPIWNWTYWIRLPYVYPKKWYVNLQHLPVDPGEKIPKTFELMPSITITSVCDLYIRWQKRWRCLTYRNECKKKCWDSHAALLKKYLYHF